MSKLKLTVLSDEPFTAFPNSPGYRGIERAIPEYYDHLSIDHPINQAFLWNIGDMDNDLMIDNVEKAYQIVERYKLTDQKFNWEILEVTEENEPPQRGDEFVGFELTVAGRSLINRGLEHLCRNRYFDSSFLSAIESDNAVEPLLCLLVDQFQSKINWAGLFNEYNEARYCLASMMAIQKFVPHFWEHDTSSFRVIGLWMVAEL